MTVLTSFIVFITGFLAIGPLSSRYSTGERYDYYLASRSISPFLTGVPRWTTKTPDSGIHDVVMFKSYSYMLKLFGNMSPNTLKNSHLKWFVVGCPPL